MRWLFPQPRVLGEPGGQLSSGQTLEGLSGLSWNFSRSPFTPCDPSRFVLFYSYALPMCEVLPGLCCLFWSRSETQQLSYFLGCRAPCAAVRVPADPCTCCLEAAFLILKTIIHLPFLFQWRCWRVSTCFPGLSPGDAAEWVKWGDLIK